MMKKHFEAIARGLYQAKADMDTIKSVTREIESFNPNFNRARFIVACTHPVVHEALVEKHLRRRQA
jgi:hypothetical protein